MCNVCLLANPSLDFDVMVQTASHCSCLPLTSRRTTFAHVCEETKIAITLPRWQLRNTLQHGGPRAICQCGIRLHMRAPHA